MPKATNYIGQLNNIDNCYIDIPGAGKIEFNIMPEIGDSKSASYNDEPLIGRSFPLKTFSHGDNRVITWQIHLVVDTPASIERNLRYMRWLESAVYTRTSQAGAPFVPPPVCELKCGYLLAVDEAVCAILKSYSVKFPTDVAFDVDLYGTLCPYKFDIDTTWDVVYSSDDLPGQDRIVQIGK